LDRNVGVLLADASSVDAALALTGNDAQWFLMDDGINALPSLQARIDAGSDVTICATDAAGLEPVPGVRFGSQYDHAAMLRSSSRLIAMTGVRVDDHRPRRDERTVVVRITRPRKAGQALRTAVGYAAGDLRVAVLVEVPDLIERPPPDLARALATLRSLDHPIVTISPGDYPPRLRWDIEVAW
jgi:hypothetical protein